VISLIILSLLFTGIGLISGYYSAYKTYGDKAAADEQMADDAAAKQLLSPEALKNMGVVVEEIALTSYTRYQPVTAVVTATPFFNREIYAPVSGRIKSVDVNYGAMVHAGEVVVTLVQDPLPRATLALTEEVIKPVSQNLHETIASFRRASISVEILKKELTRLTSYDKVEGGLPLVPEKDIIKIRYDLMQAEREFSIEHSELERHGMSLAQIIKIEKGEIPPIDVTVWLSALKHNGFWTPLAQEVYSTLPDKLKTFHWTVATIGELVAGDLVNEIFVDWLKKTPGAAERFLEIGGLLQRGHNLEEIKELYILKALDPVVMIRAPDAAPDWDVQAVFVKPGKHVEQGETLLTLENPRALYLCGEPTDGDIESVLHAMKSKALIEARPLVKGSGPMLSNLSVNRLFNRDGNKNAALYTPFDNKPLLIEGGFRTWLVREGQRFELRIPKMKFDKAYVFPTDAVVDDGPDKILFLKSGDSFKKVNVEVLYQDHEVVVLPASTNIFPGNPVVVRGAFSLKMAFQDSGKPSGHAHGPGCDHIH